MQKNIIAYDASVIEKSASDLYSKANSIIGVSIFRGVVVGLLCGLIFGAFVLPIFRPHTGVSLNPMTAVQISALIFSVAGAFSGYTSGMEKSFRFMLEAQVALCQVQIEKNTSSKG